jgi:outer membrane protein assembly factor BamA
MGRKIAPFLLLSLFYAALLLPQEWQSTDGRWTDKNNTEKYAAYLLSAAYAEHGYYGAKVEIKQAGTKRLFIVDPGQIFRVKEVLVSGLQTFPEHKIVQDAPKPGDIYSAARTNEWIQELVKSYVEKNGPLKLVNWGARYDHAHAQVTIQLTLQERH